MDNAKNILVSIEERHVQNLLNGSKTIELRRRNINIPKGSKVWIYSKIPTGKISAIGTVDYIYNDTPSNIWQQFSTVAGISKSEFDEYFANRSHGCAIVFDSIVAVDNALPLDFLRSKLDSFQPPQFFKYLYEDSPELDLFRQEALA